MSTEEEDPQPGFTHLPSAVGLYDPRLERESCGVGFVINIDGIASHKLLLDAKSMAVRMEHRGACACDNNSGDGAGVMTSIPHRFYQRLVWEEMQVQLPSPGSYGTGIVFMDQKVEDRTQELFQDIANSLDLKVLCWRAVKTDNSSLGQMSKDSEPTLRQVFVVPRGTTADFSLRLYQLKKLSTHNIPRKAIRYYLCSLSTSIIVYKGQLTSEQVWTYFQELQDPEFESYLAIVHARYSTNTFPSWERAHPLRCLAHNGEINTLRGNVNRMKAREGVMASPVLSPEQLRQLYPVVEPHVSDSGSLDCVLDFLIHAGRWTLPAAMMALVPEAWEDNNLMTPQKKEFYQWSSCVMEPWDGPALVISTDGQNLVATLDRNGLRPARYCLTRDNCLVLASEVGVVDIAPDNCRLKGRLRPGRMLLIDTDKKAFLRDEEVKMAVAARYNLSSWFQEMTTLQDIVEAYGEVTEVSRSWDPRKLSLCGYTPETTNILLLPMLEDRKEALGSMGNDAPLACLSQLQPLLYDYFQQIFAQVTNPPIDPFREKIVTSLACPIGPEGNLLEPNASQCRRLLLQQPVLSRHQMVAIKKTSYKGWKTTVLDLTYPIKEGPGGLLPALERLCDQAAAAVGQGSSILVLSDLGASPTRVPISAPLGLGAVHHHLIQQRLRMRTALLVETEEAREVHHMCVLLGYGADAICPHLVLEIGELWSDRELLSTQLTSQQAFANLSAAMGTGISKVMAKMGISTLKSYKAAQSFEAVGLSQEVVDKCFRDTPSRLAGATFRVLAEEALTRHRLAYGESACDRYVLRDPGFYHWRSGGEVHLNEPMSIANLQEAAALSSKEAYARFIESTMKSLRHCTLRGLLGLEFSQTPLPLSEVEPVSSILRKFVTGAMSLGSISRETHTTLAVAMNRVGGRSNTGEGGEDPSRWQAFDLNNNQRSAIKQVASGRFGVTIHYLTNSDELQIKMAQGAKPGEGGELPGHKVTEEIAKLRCSVPGVGLISPPPHHDIYSIEDLAQLIYDLKCANPAARISVKLVSEVGVGVVASGVAKGKAEHITISGHDGGTGASSWTGIKHAGMPWELGLAETHQALVLNGLRDRTVLQVDGQLRTGFDVVVAAILGADEFAFSTAPLIVLGCTMMRKCHLNTCPVGIATQDPELRKKFEGKPEHVVNYLFLLAEEVRLLLSKLGARSLKELVGRTERLSFKPPASNPKSQLLDLSRVLVSALHLRRQAAPVAAKPDFELQRRMDVRLIELCDKFLEGTERTLDVGPLEITNRDRAFGTTLSHHLSRRFGEQSLPDGRSIKIKLRGSAGQSLGAFLTRGVSIELEGEANDYVGKGLSGGELVLYPDRSLPEDFQSERNVIAGNVCLYGAVSGKAMFRGIAAERFCVRNSGALAVVEGVGDHGCEYMTGGTVVILGLTGRNFAAGMSGGVAYVLNKSQPGFGSLEVRCNPESVDLLPVEEEEDIKFLQSIISEFFQRTGSAIAKKIMNSWPQSAGQFIKVFPREYQRALKALAAGAPNEEQPVRDIEDVVPDKVRGFMRYRRHKGSYRPTKVRLQDREEIYDHGLVRPGLKVQAARCMDCGVPFCQSEHGCPLENIIPKWNDLVYQDNWKEALNQLLQTNNFPEFTGRVCPAPCEGACVLGINEDPVTIKNIECAIIEHGWEQGWMVPSLPAVRTGRRVAVVGSGPAGMAAAHQLNKAGHSVTVFEKNDKLGGLLRYGIPTMKLDKKILDRRLDLLRKEGIKFVTNADIGTSMPVSQLLDQFEAVLLALGSTVPRDLRLPGRELRGIHFAMEYLENDQKGRGGELDARGKHVVVIGGGDTGVDCMATAVRQGAAWVTTLELIPEPPATRGAANPWPQWPRILRQEYGHQEVAVRQGGNDPRRYSILAKEYVSKHPGKVAGMLVSRIRWSKSDNGRWDMEEIPGTEDIIKADLVLLALGFRGPTSQILDSLGLEKDLRQCVPAPKYRTPVPRVYAAGDCRVGQSLVVTAIAEGRQAARTLDQDLMGRSSLAGPGGLL